MSRTIKGRKARYGGDGCWYCLGGKAKKRTIKERILRREKQALRR